MLNKIRSFIFSHIKNGRYLHLTKPRFLIVAPSFSHRSAGIRALYRLCHHLNEEGYPSAVIPIPGVNIDDYSPWNVFGYKGKIEDAVVIYPEIVSGNPCKAARVVRWVLNDPGLLGGDSSYEDSEVVFVYDPNKIGIVNKAIKTPIGQERVLWVGVVDPAIIYPDPKIEKVLNLSYTYKGHALSEKFPLDPSLGVKRLEDFTPDMSSLGDLLRKTKTLYSYDHYSNLLREAAICGCEVKTINSNGEWHDPMQCNCLLNIVWSHNFRDAYKSQFFDSRVVDNFIAELPSSWNVRKASRFWLFYKSIESFIFSQAR